MLEIIIVLLISLGVNLDNENITVLDQSTGISFGVGTQVTSGGRPVDSGEPLVYVLLQDDAGNYYLERR
jgi:hypothetical protein